MKKHFLLLVMALISMTSWAQTTSIGEVAIGSYTYGTATYPIPVVKDNQGAILTETTHYTVSADAYADAEFKTVVAKQDMKGGVNYYLKITGVGAYDGQTKPVYFTCQKKTLNITIDPTLFTPQRDYLVEDEPELAATAWSAAALVTGEPWSDTKAELGTLTYTYAGKGNKDYPGGVYPITFSGLSSDCYNIVYPTMNFTIVGTDMTSKTITVKTPFADQTYKGAAFTAADLTGLVLKYGDKELVQGTDFDIALRYNFESFAAETGGTAAAEGTIEIVSQTGDEAIVKVIELSSGSTPEEGKLYKVTGLNGTTRKQLMGDGTGSNYTTTSGMWVTITESFKNVSTTAYPCVVNFKGDYSGTRTDIASFKIVKADLNVYVNNISKVYDGTDEIYGGTSESKTQPTVAFSGLKGADAATTTPFGADAFSVAYVTPATTNKNVASYALKPVQKDGLTIANYNVNPLNTGMLTVTAKAITVKPVADDKELGEADPEFTVDASKAIRIGSTEPYTLDDQTPVASAYKVSRDEGNTIGKYTMSLTLKSDEELGALAGASATAAQKAAKVTEIKTVLANYDITLGTAEFEITAGTLYVYPKSEAVTYGTETPDFQIVAMSAKGVAVTLTNADALSVVIDGQAEAPKKVGTYVLKVEGTPTATGYTADKIVKLDGQYTIGKKSLTYVLEAQTLENGAAETKLNKKYASATGLVEGDVIGFKLAFNQVTAETTGTEGMIPKNSDPDIYVVAATSSTAAKLGDAANNTSFAKGVKMVEVASTTDDPNDNANYEITWATGKLIVGTGSPEVEGVTFASIDDDPTTTGTDESDIAKIRKYAGETQTVKFTFNPRNGRTLGAERNWKAGYWNTMVLPFDISVADLSKALGYAIVNVIDPTKTEISATESKFYGKLTMKGGNGSEEVLKANKPFMLKLADDIVVDKVYTFGSQKIVAPASEDDLTVDAGGGAKFIGTYNTKAVTSEDNAAIWFMLGNYAGWAYIGATSKNTWNIVPFEGYIDMSNLPAGARNITFYAEELDGSVTAIKSISTDNGSKLSSEGWYNLNGMKLQGAPTQKGIYIQNGKKVIVK